MNATTFNNRLADGIAPVLAGHQEVNIGAQTINNYEHALIYSDGTLAVGGAQGADGTVTGRAGTINNHSATIESAAVAMDSERGTIRIIPTPLVSLSPTAASHQNLNRNRPVTMKRGRDTIMTDALVSGDSVKATVGHDLIMTSEQDSDKYESKQQSASAGGTFNICSMGGSASVNLSKDKMHSNYQSVQEQTGIFAGKGDFDIDVANHTQLNGAVIASDANAGKKPSEYRYAEQVRYSQSGQL